MQEIEIILKGKKRKENEKLYEIRDEFYRYLKDFSSNFTLEFRGCQDSIIRSYRMEEREVENFMYFLKKNGYYYEATIKNITVLTNERQE